ncbi:MAG: hypothetical protein OXI69_16620 [Acidobacteriota bacterium]|nr:hypothetical protein [Acidobacteriota bacterium]
MTPVRRLRRTRHGKQLSVGSEFDLQPTSPDTNPLNLELEGFEGKEAGARTWGLRIRMSIPI